MIAFVGFDPGCNLLVAVQALLVGDLLTQDVTFNAIGHPLQVCVGLCQVPRTQLGKELSRNEDQGQGHQCPGLNIMDLKFQDLSV